MTVPLRRMAFSEIVAPITPGEFFARYWTREGVLLRHEGRTFDDRFGWDAVTAILNAGDITFPKIKLSHRDRPVPADQFTFEAGGLRIVDGRAVLSQFEDGASFGITGADSHWPPLRSVVDGLYDALLESIHTNVYCSPANTQGFQCHFDLHEVFVLQVDGEKHWRVFRPTTDAPVGSWKAEDSPHTIEAPYLDVVLRPGDVLYVPRGHWHYAVAEDSTSLHVTVGVTCRKGSEFLDWLGGELLDEPAWRENLPLLASATADGMFQPPAGFRAWSAAIRRSLEDKLADPDLFERFCRDTLAGIQPVHNAVVANGPFAIETLRFERPAGRRHYFANASDDGDVTVSIGGSEIQLEPADRDLLARILDAESFTLADIRMWKPNVDLEAMTELLTELTRAGFLLPTAL